MSFRGAGPQELSLHDFFDIFSRNRRLLFGFPLVAAIAAAGISLMLPNIFTGRAIFMPPQQQQQSAAAMLLGQLGVFSGGGGTGLGLKNPNDLYVGILRSRTIADALIGRFDLKKLYEEKTMTDARNTLARNTLLTSGKDGLIVVEVDDDDPQRAADLANAYVEELQKLTSSLAISEAGQRRVFFERQLMKSKEDLTKAEAELKATQERTGLVQLDQQGRAAIEAVATLQAQIVVREVNMSAMRSYATEDNPELVRIRQEIKSLRTELSRLQRGGGSGQSVLVPTGKIPEAGLEYVRKFREVKYAETVLELLAKQFELAKIDEARDSGVVQSVDLAVPPDKKSKPWRSAIVVAVTLVAFVFCLFFVLARERLSSRKESRRSSNGIQSATVASG